MKTPIRCPAGGRKEAQGGGIGNAGELPFAYLTLCAASRVRYVFARHSGARVK